MRTKCWFVAGVQVILMLDRWRIDWWTCESHPDRRYLHVGPVLFHW